MPSCVLAIELDRPDRTYRAGELLRGTVFVRVDEPCRCAGVRVDLGWRTSGRGYDDEDTETILADVPEREWSAGTEYSWEFEAALPHGPLEHTGRLLRVEWFVRASVDIPWALDPRDEVVVRLLPSAELHPAEYDHGPRFDAPTERIERPESVNLVVLVLVVGLIPLVGLVGVVAWLTSLSWFLDPKWSLALLGGGVYASWYAVTHARLGVRHIEIGSVHAHPSQRIPVKLHLRPVRGVMLRSVTAVLCGRESVRHSGTNRGSTWTTETFVEIPTRLSGIHTLAAGQRLELAGEVEVPPDAAPSFASDSNRVEWVVEFRVDAERYPLWTHEFSVAMLPSGARSIADPAERRARSPSSSAWPSRSARARSGGRRRASPRRRPGRACGTRRAAARRSRSRRVGARR
jgi:hypothetical protein